MASGRPRERRKHSPSEYGYRNSQASNPASTALSLISNPNHTLQLRLQKTGAANRQTKDNFYTPKNNFFYDKSPYLPLDPRRREIRLLKVFAPKSYSDHIWAKPEWALINQADGQPFQLNDHNLDTLLSSNPEFGIHNANAPLLAVEILDKISLSRVDDAYCALSYCAGDPTDTSLILVDGLPFNAFSNLAHAIGLILAHWTSKNPKKNLLLWADQICINQRDHIERAAQVNLMRDIYRRSGETFICLSTPALTDPLAWASTITTEAEKSGRNSIALLEQKIEQTLIVRKTDSNPSHETDPWLESVQAFLTNRWWRRCWVYQELISSPRPHLFSRSTCLSWSDISSLMEWLCFNMDDFLDDALNEPTIHQSANDFFTSEKSAIQTLRTNEEHRQQSEQQVYQMQVKAYEQSLQLQENRRRDAEAQRLQIGHELQAVQKEISSMGWTYSALTGQTRPKAKRLWAQQKSLQDRLANSQSSRSTSDYLYLPAPPGPSTLDAQIGQLRLKWQAELEIAASQRRRIRELDVSAVRSMLSGKLNARRGLDLKILLQHSRNCEASDPRDRVYAFLGLAHRSYGIDPDYSFANTVIHTLIQTAQHIIRYDKSLNILQHVGRGRDKLGTFLPTWVPDWTSKEVASSFDRYTSSLDSKGKHIAFNASNGLCTEPVFRHDKTGEANIDLKVKGVFLDHLDEPKGPVSLFPDLSRFVTSHGGNIVAPRSALIDDEVWVLYGATRPVLLRAEGEDSYAFLGEVLQVEDDWHTSSPLMFGELFKGKNTAKVEEREIWLI